MIKENIKKVIYKKVNKDSKVIEIKNDLKDLSKRSIHYINNEIEL